MKNLTSGILFVVLLFAVMSCGLIDRFTTRGGSMNRASDLWGDVPRMDGMSPSDLELPLTIKILMRTALNNLWRFSKEGEDKTPVNGDWIVFTSVGTPADVQSFYTNSRMTSFGNWEASKKSTCLDGKGNGIDGVMCVFNKLTDNKEIMLAIIAIKDDESKQTNVFYLRLEKDADAATNSATSNKP